MSMGAIEKNKRACATQECEPPFVGKEACEFFVEDGSCRAPDMRELATKLSTLAARRK